MNTTHCQKGTYLSENVNSYWRNEKGRCTPCGFPDIINFGKDIDQNNLNLAEKGVKTFINRDISPLLDENEKSLQTWKWKDKEDKDLEESTNVMERCKLSCETPRFRSENEKGNKIGYLFSNNNITTEKESIDNIYDLDDEDIKPSEKNGLVYIHGQECVDQKIKKCPHGYYRGSVERQYLGDKSKKEDPTKCYSCVDPKRFTTSSNINPANFDNSQINSQNIIDGDYKIGLLGILRKIMIIMKKI